MRALARACVCVARVCSCASEVVAVSCSPSSKDQNGDRLEAGDVVTHIDGERVDKHNIVQHLRGDDVPGTELAVTVHKQTHASSLVTFEDAGPSPEGVEVANAALAAALEQADRLEFSKEKLEALQASDLPASCYIKVGDRYLQRVAATRVVFRLTRADMRTVMVTKDLYLALGEVHAELEKLGDPQETLQRKLELVELNIEAVTSFAHEEQANLRAHVNELEDALRGALESLEQERAVAGDLRKQCAKFERELRARKEQQASSDAEQGDGAAGAGPSTPHRPLSMTRQPLPGCAFAPASSQTARAPLYSFGTPRLSRDIPSTPRSPAVGGRERGENEREARGAEERAGVGVEKRVLSNGVQIWVTKDNN